jgi:hypothetical protein
MTTVDDLLERAGDWWFEAAILLTAIGVGLALANGGVPRWAHVYLLGTAAAFVVGYIPVSKIVKWLYSPDFTYLLVLNAQEAGFELHALGPEEWEELEVKGGKLRQLTALQPVYDCYEFDPESMTARVRWRGTENDLELLAHEQRIDECYGRLERLARRGMEMRVKHRSIIRDAAMQIVESAISTAEAASIPSGEEIEKAVDNALTDFDDDPDEDAQPLDEERIEDMAEDVAGTDHAEQHPDPAQQGGAPADD